MSENANRQITRAEVIRKAQSDNNFKKMLLENPKAALGQLGVNLPEDVEVKVVEESTKTIYLVLPVDPNELTEEQLDLVAGGKGPRESTYM